MSVLSSKSATKRACKPSEVEMQQFPKFNPGNKFGSWDNDRAFMGWIYPTSGKIMIWQTGWIWEVLSNMKLVTAHTQY